MSKFWNTLSQAAKISFVGGLIFILTLTVVAGFWVFRADYQVLFADMKPQDSAVMITELDRLKIPYKIGEGGNTILVEKDVVHSTRLKLLGKDLPLHGVVGLELFNNSDFGMTEFAQKINYQRALQGEITRTISSLEEIQDVRVHLALPEEGLFKRAQSKAKAAITIALKPGHLLRNEQTLGIQRLVAAAVPGILAQDVTIVDKHGVALTRLTGQAEQDVVSGGLELKKETEVLLTKKVNEVLVRAFGENQASASVDVILNMDQIKVTTEDVLSAPSVNGQIPTGVVVKEKESLHDIPAPLDANNGGAVTKAGTSVREVDYQVGKRVEQIVSQPGAIKRISAVAIIHKDLTEEQREQLKDLVAAAVGANVARGDNIVVQSLASFVAKEVSNEQAGNLTFSSGGGLNAPSLKNDKDIMPALSSKVTVILGVILISFLLLVIFVFARRPAHSQARMTEQQRVNALKNVQQWMSAEDEKVDSQFDVKQ